MAYNNPLLIRPVADMPRRIGVIGAGAIGPDIGYYLKSAIPGLRLALIDIRPQALDAALDRIHAHAEKGLARDKLTPTQAEDVRRNILVSTDDEALAGCDWVIEAATENIELKKRIFARVEAIVDASCMITSNTSAIPANMLFSHLRHPERATVTHFFAPAFRNPAVEVIDWEKADPELVQRLRRLFCLTGKTPMVTRDVVCFMLDRIFDNWCNEAGFLLSGATPAQVDCVAGDYVHAGPFFVLNMANGNPIIIETNSLQAQLEGDHYRPADVFRAAPGRAGQDADGKWITVEPGQDAPISEAAAARIRERLLGVLFSQTVDILDRDIGAPADLELGCRLAFAFRQGPLELMRQLGEEESRRILTKFIADRPGMPDARRPLHAYQDFDRFILVDDLDGVKIITLRRPEALNALHDDMTDELLALLKKHENDPQSAGFVITGYGVTAFSAGADIGRFPAMLGDRERCIAYARACSRLLVYLDGCQKPVVAALNGMALGGGLELAVRCHGIVAVESAWLQFPEITLGLAPGLGALAVPYRRWPGACDAFHGMLLRAEKMNAANAAELGIIDALAADHAALLPAAAQLVRERAPQRRFIGDAPVAISPPAPGGNGRGLSAEVSGIIRAAIIEAAAAPSLEQALAVGYAAFGASALTAAAREGIGAFMEKRKPDFTP